MSNFRKITNEELEKILVNHRHWLYKDAEGWEDMRADFSNADLIDKDLSNKDLFGAKFYNANLSYANLYHANLSCADLSCAKIYRANLSNANLYYANLFCANLSGANLFYANLSGANLCNAYLYNANLFHVDFYGAKNIPYIPMACPEKGEFIGYKKACNKIVVLSIPADAKRSSAAGRICRCNKAKVLEIDDIGGAISDIKEACSVYDNRFVYRVGEIVYVDDFDDNRFNECSSGIHFFINRKEAEEYI